MLGLPPTQDQFPNTGDGWKAYAKASEEYYNRLGQDVEYEEYKEEGK